MVMVKWYITLNVVASLLCIATFPSLLVHSHLHSTLFYAVALVARNFETNASEHPLEALVTLFQGWNVLFSPLSIPPIVLRTAGRAVSA